MTKLFSIVALALSLFVVGCGKQNTESTGTVNPATPTTSVPMATVDELAAARTNYANLCQTCHGESGDGGTVTIDDKTLKVPSLRAGHAVTHSDQELVKQVLDGGDGMPAFKEKVSAREAADLVKFVRQHFQGK
ncbi:MAG TPA: cytochrome c [Pyrinomonadaceae bacterium]|nr:cytochrome c [Pyrinomonadaceae bacterium]